MDAMAGPSHHERLCQLELRIERLEQMATPAYLRGEVKLAPIPPMKTTLGNTSEPPSKETR